MLAVAVTVVTLDAVSKALAVHFLTRHGRVSVLGGALHLELYRNFAGPHNALEGHPVLVSLIAIAAVAAIGVLATRVRSPGLAISAGMLLGGGIGNVLDRLLRGPGPLRGGVVDWLQPLSSNGSMNLADLSITIAVVVAVVAVVLSRSRTRPVSPATP